MREAEGLRRLTLRALGLLVVRGWESLPVLVPLGFVGALGTAGFSVAAPALRPTSCSRPC